MPNSSLDKDISRASYSSKEDNTSSNMEKQFKLEHECGEPICKTYVSMEAIKNTSHKFPDSGLGPIVEPQIRLSTLPKAKRILYTSIKKSFEIVEDSPTGNLFHTMCSRYCVSEIELLTNYKLFENSLRQTLYDGAEIILDILKEEMLQYVAIKNQTLTINDILEEISSKERRNTKG